MGPAPYGLRWTSRLICRDLRGLAGSCTSKARSLLSRTPAAPEPVVDIQYQDTIAYAPRQQIEVDTEPPADTEGLHDGSHQNSVPSSSHSPDSESQSTLPTEVAHAGFEVSSTLYDLLGSKLKDLYASRERHLPLNERWTFRGAWLVLDMAVQYCASNPSYSILNPNSPSPDETALLLKVLQYSLSKPLIFSTSRVSQMPTMPCNMSTESSTRHDSIYDAISIRRPRTPTPALCWYAVFEGATDRAKTIQAAAYLLGHVWPEQDASVILEVVGNPAKRLLEEKHTEFRKTLGSLLYTEEDALR